MPRLTNQQYLQRHRALRRIWLEADQFFGVVSYTQQMDVHTFYAPARDWSDDKMLGHRLKVQEFVDSLPQRASRAYLKIEAAYLAPVNRSTPMKAFIGEKNVRVTAIAKPVPNGSLLIQALEQLEDRNGRSAT